MSAPLVVRVTEFFVGKASTGRDTLYLQHNTLKVNF